jgi:hypothetical protein
MSRHSTRSLRSLVMTAFLLPAAALAGERAGVVTTLEGTATVVRTATPEPAALKFKDDVFVRDRITTSERSFVRVLLGGKATVTAREQTVLTITEVPGTATIHVASGRISVSVSKDKMKPGDVVEITTPNAKAAIRGTIVVAEVASARSVITVLRGLIDVTRLDSATGRSIGAPVSVSIRESITVSGASLLPLPQPTRISPARANSLGADFTVLPKNPPAASMAPAVAESVQRAVQDIAAVLPQAATSASASTTSGSSDKTGGSSDKSGSNSDKVSTGSDKAASSAGAASEKATIIVDKVSVATTQSDGGSGKGLGTSGGSATTTSLPTDGASGLAVGNAGTPGNGSAAAPVVNAVTPVISAVAPVVTPVAPVVTPVAPIVSSVAPVVTPVAPIASTVAPVVTPVAPIVSAVPPVVSVVAPGHGVANATGRPASIPGNAFGKTKP